MAGGAANRPANVMAMGSAGRRGTSRAEGWAAGAIRAPQRTARWASRAATVRPARSSCLCPVRSLSGYRAARARRRAGVPSAATKP